MELSRCISTALFTLRRTRQLAGIFPVPSPLSWSGRLPSAMGSADTLTVNIVREAEKSWVVRNAEGHEAYIPKRPGAKPDVWGRLVVSPSLFAAGHARFQDMAKQRAEAKERAQAPFKKFCSDLHPVSGLRKSPSGKAVAVEARFRYTGGTNEFKTEVWLPVSVLVDWKAPGWLILKKARTLLYWEDPSGGTMCQVTNIGGVELDQRFVSRRSYETTKLIEQLAKQPPPLPAE